MKILLNESSLIAPYFSDKTGVPFYDDILKKPVYMFWKKRVYGIIEYKSGMEYLSDCAAMQKTTVKEQIKFIENSNGLELVKKYERDMLDGDKFPMIFLDYDSNLQEGRHRALAVHNINPKLLIPVLVIEQVKDLKRIYEKVKSFASYQEAKDFCEKNDYPIDNSTFNAIKNDILY